MTNGETLIRIGQYANALDNTRLEDTDYTLCLHFGLGTPFVSVWLNSYGTENTVEYNITERGVSLRGAGGYSGNELAYITELVENWYSAGELL